MIYHLNTQNGDTLAVPQLVFSNLARADENCIRIALYILQTGSTDPRAIARDLGLRSVHAATSALQWWAGAGLLSAERGRPPEEVPPPPQMEEIDVALLLCDPKVAALTEHAQICFGGALSDSSAHELVALYQRDGYPADVVMLCLSYLASQGNLTVRKVEAELERWRKAGVKNGETAERHLTLLEKRVKREAFAANLVGKVPDDLTTTEKRYIARWYEKWQFSDEMVATALRHLDHERSIWALNDILKLWAEKGWQTPNDIRGGTVFGHNVRVDSTNPTGANRLNRNIRSPLKLKRED